MKRPESFKMNQSYCYVRNFHLRYYATITVNELWLVVITWYSHVSANRTSYVQRFLKATHGQLTELRLKPASLNCNSTIEIQSTGIILNRCVLGRITKSYSWRYYSRIVKTELGRNTPKKLSISVCEVTTKLWNIGILDFPNEQDKGTV